MTDLLVKLYERPDPSPFLAALGKMDIFVQRAMACERRRVLAWVQHRFGDGWSAECEAAFGQRPIACRIAIQAGKLPDFACHDCTRPNFFGPIGIDPAFRDRGIGRALLAIVLNDMAHAGYAYAIIGGAGPISFFENCVGATVIPGSTPGIYRTSIADDHIDRER